MPPAYRGMWQDFAAAGATSDWQSPRLGRSATAVALTNLSRGLYADRYNRLVTRGSARSCSRSDFGGTFGVPCEDRYHGLWRLHELVEVPRGQRSAGRQPLVDAGRSMPSSRSRQTSRGSSGPTRVRAGLEGAHDWDTVLAVARPQICPDPNRRPPSVTSTSDPPPPGSTARSSAPTAPTAATLL